MSCIKQGKVGELARELKENKNCMNPRYNNYEQTTESVRSVCDYSLIMPDPTL